jgi:hypothetical protein
MRTTFLFALVVAAVLGLTFANPQASAHVAVMVSPFAPPSRAIEVIAAAGGSAVGQSRLSWIVLAAADRGDFISALYGAGALLVFDPRVAGGCFSER